MILRLDENQIEELVDSVAGLSIKLIQCAWVCAEEVRDRVGKSESREVASEEFADIFFEFLFLFLHMVDRKASVTFSERNRKDFMDILVEGSLKASVETMIPEDREPERKQAELERLSGWERRQETYWRYGESPVTSDEPEKDTLPWAFGKVLSQVAVGRDEGAYASVGARLTQMALGEIDILATLERIMKQEV